MGIQYDIIDLIWIATIHHTPFPDVKHLPGQLIQKLKMAVSEEKGGKKKIDLRLVNQNLQNVLTFALMKRNHNQWRLSESRSVT